MEQERPIMRDTWGRTIDYLRISLTDRCNLRCRYCMPSDVPSVSHDDILRYEEILEICEAAVSLGINRFKVTGGEPLVRKGALSFISRLTSLPGVRDMTLTTNGQLLQDALPALMQAGVSSINISLDTLLASQYAALTGGGRLDTVLSAVRQALTLPIRIKLNAVLLEETASQILPLAMLARDWPLDVRFIELMPIGCGRQMKGIATGEALSRLKQVWPDLTPCQRHGNGPAVYYGSASLTGNIGFIGANTHRFCHSCNRLRLTSTGILKPCLCYEQGVSVKDIIRGGRTDRQERLRQAVARAVLAKPEQHQFADADRITEHKTMNQIGG